MDDLPFAHLDLSAIFLEPLFVELSRSRVLSGNKLNSVVRPKHPCQAQSDGLKPLMEKERISPGVVRGDPVYGQREIYEPSFADRMERTPAHFDITMAEPEPDLRNHISPRAHFNSTVRLRVSTCAYHTIYFPPPFLTCLELRDLHRIRKSLLSHSNAKETSRDRNRTIKQTRLRSQPKAQAVRPVP
jgi:hypothetical protein